MNLIDSVKQEYKLSHNVPIPIEILDQKISSPYFPGLYHYHDYIEIIYCIEGQLEVKTFYKNVILNKDEIMLINSNESHGTMALTPNNRHYCIKFLKDLLTPFYEKDINHYLKMTNAISKMGPFVVIPAENVLKHDNNIKALFSEAALFDAKKVISGNLMVYANILSIFSFILRCVDHNFSDNIDIHLIKNNQDIIQKTNLLINENYQDITLAKLARECSVNYSYFSTLFKDLYGESFKKYLIKFRINKSISLLCETNIDISTIAQTVGFATSSHYIKMFKQLKNISPAKFRQLTQSRNI